MGNALFNTSAGLLDSHIGAQQPLFQELRAQDTSFFDEGPNQITNKPRSPGSLSGSLSNLSSSWPYLQGVEITCQRQYDAGLVKIWSGEPGHASAAGEYGQGEVRISSPFSDDETAYLTDPTSVLHGPSGLFPVMLFPIQPATHASTLPGVPRYVTRKGGRNRYRITPDVATLFLDGVVEPLQLRPRPSFYSSDVPGEATGVRGQLQQGNPDSNAATDSVLTVDAFDVRNHQAAFVDRTPCAPPKSGHVVAGSKATAFIDARLIRNALLPSSEGSSLTSALSLMTGSTDGYVRYDQISATSGWYYDSIAGVGTDSIAFGGMTH